MYCRTPNKFRQHSTFMTNEDENLHESFGYWLPTNGRHSTGTKKLLADKITGIRLVTPQSRLLCAYWISQHLANYGICLLALPFRLFHFSCSFLFSSSVSANCLRLKENLTHELPPDTYEAWAAIGKTEKGLFDKGSSLWGQQWQVFRSTLFTALLS